VFTYHEFGHGTRAASAGFKPYFGHGFIGSEEDLKKAIRSGELKDNFFSFWLSSITNTSGFAIATASDTLFSPLDEAEFIEFGIDGLVPAGGLNNEMYFTEAIEDQIHRDGGHIGYWPSYAMAKLSATSYEQGETIFNVFASVGATIGRVVEPRLDLRYHVLENVRLSAGYTYYNPKNLNGERLIPSLENRSDFHEAYVGLAVVY